MVQIATGTADIRHDSLSLIPLGGQSEFGQLLWAVCHAGEIIVVDAGAAVPAEDLPGVDLLFPNINFLAANQEKIQALLLTNGHEEHCGAVGYLLRHLDLKRILAPSFVCHFLKQGFEAESEHWSRRNESEKSACIEKGESLPEFVSLLEEVEHRKPYRIGSFEVEWLRVNNAIADASALRISTRDAQIIYTSSFKLDPTPADRSTFDFGGFATACERGVSILVSDSAGVENDGYTPSELSLRNPLGKELEKAAGRVVVVLPGSNTHRLQLLFELARQSGRKAALVGESLHRVAIAAAMTGNLEYDRSIETTIESAELLPDNEILYLTGGVEDDPLVTLRDLAYGNCRELSLKRGDTVIYSANVVPGNLRHMAKILDKLLALGVKAVDPRHGVHVSKHASREELKFMLSLTKPRYFVPAIGEIRHIMHHKQLAQDWGLPEDSIFALSNGEILELDRGLATVIGSVESQSVLFNREQGERVTTFSVHERRALSLEGVITITLAIDSEGNPLSRPSIISGASGFSRSPDWPQIASEMISGIEAVVEKLAQQKGPVEIPQVRASVREYFIKTLRSKLSAKPTVQVVVHKLE